MSLTYKREDIKKVDTDFLPSIVDKKKYAPNEEKIALFKKIHRNSFKIVDIARVNKDKSIGITVNLMRNYNEGRHGDWNNYCSFK